MVVCSPVRLFASFSFGFSLLVLVSLCTVFVHTHTHTLAHSGAKLSTNTAATDLHAACCGCCCCCCRCLASSLASVGFVCCSREDVPTAQVDNNNSQIRANDYRNRNRNHNRHRSVLVLSQSQSLSQSQLSDNRCHSHSHSRNHSDETVVQHCRRDLRQVAANAIERSSSTTTQKKVIYYILVWCLYLSPPFPRTPLARVCNNYNDLPSRLFVFLLFFCDFCLCAKLVSS